MEKVDTASIAPDDAINRLFNESGRARDNMQKESNRANNEFDKAKDVLGKSKNNIHEGFE